MKKIKNYIIQILLLLSLFLTLTSITRLHAQDYTPTQKEQTAYDVCADYVKSSVSLKIDGKTYKQQKKVYHDFLSDYNAGNCGKTDTNDQIDNQDINAPGRVIDPFTNKVIYEGEKDLDPKNKDTSPYQIALRKVKTKVSLINKFLVEDFKYTSWNEISNTLTKLYDYNFSSKRTVQSEKRKLTKIVESIVFNEKFNKVETSNEGQIARIYLVSAVVITITSIVVYITFKIRRT